MIMNSRDYKDVQTKQEGDATDFKVPKTSSTSRQWAGFKNPRIVRVSRAFGGKDRHSKVCTVRGLRDRRIRLSVPTAIQLYDLQDRLGVGQPSKVVDWLLDATKQDIDKLPPLQMPPGNFSQFHQQALFPQESISPQPSLSHLFNANSVKIKDGGINIKGNVDGNYQSSLERSNYLASDQRQISSDQKGKRRASNEQENLNNLAQNFFPLPNQSSSFPGLLNNVLPYNPYFHWEPSNLSLSPFGHHYFSSQTDDSHINHHSLALPSPAPIHSGGSQLYFCPSMATMLPSIPPYLPPYMNVPTVENEMKKINHLQHLSSSSQHDLPNSMMPSLHLMKSFPFNGNSKANPSHENVHNDRNL